MQKRSEDGDRRHLSRCLCTEKGAGSVVTTRRSFWQKIGKILGIPVAANLVKRVHYTGYQKKLDPIGRKKNLEHAFAPGGDPDRLPTDFRRVIIIDDIYTTGNTVDQVAKVLKTMGFQKVYFLTISIGQGY